MKPGDILSIANTTQMGVRIEERYVLVSVLCIKNAIAELEVIEIKTGFKKKIEVNLEDINIIIPASDSTQSPTSIAETNRKTKNDSEDLLCPD